MIVNGNAYRNLQETATNLEESLHSVDFNLKSMPGYKEMILYDLIYVVVADVTDIQLKSLCSKF